MRKPIVFAAALLLCCSAPLAAQSIRIEFRNGKVDLTAQNATVRAIIQEWGRLGGTRIVNGDRIPGAPVTLELLGVYEREALEILLRGVAGYVVGPREITAAGTSGFDRIMILPTSNAPRPGSPGQALSSPQPSRPPIAPAADDADDDLGVVAPPQLGGARPGGPVTPRLPPPGVRQRVGQVLDQNAPGNGAQPLGTRERLQQIIDEDLADEAAPPATQPANRSPVFNVAPGSVRPGVIVPVPSPEGRPTEQEQR